MNLRNRLPQPRQVKLSGSFLRNVLIAIGVALVVVLLGYYLLFGNEQGPQTEATLPPVASSDVPLTDEQALYESLGPWEASEVVDGRERPSNQTDLAWLHPNGTIETSSSTLSGEWKPSRLAGLTNLDYEPGDELVRFTLNGDTTYSVFVGQPFIIGNNSGQVYRFSPDQSSIQSIPTTN